MHVHCFIIARLYLQSVWDASHKILYWGHLFTCPYLGYFRFSWKYIYLLQEHQFCYLVSITIIFLYHFGRANKYFYFFNPITLYIYHKPCSSGNLFLRNYYIVRAINEKVSQGKVINVSLIFVSFGRSKKFVYHLHFVNYQNNFDRQSIVWSTSAQLEVLCASILPTAVSLLVLPPVSFCCMWLLIFIFYYSLQIKDTCHS